MIVDPKNRQVVVEDDVLPAEECCDHTRLDNSSQAVGRTDTYIEESVPPARTSLVEFWTSQTGLSDSG